MRLTLEKYRALYILVSEHAEIEKVIGRDDHAHDMDLQNSLKIYRLPMYFINNIIPLLQKSDEAMKNKVFKDLG